MPDSPLDLAAAYALGALTAEEARQFEAMLATSAEARREVDEYREVVALLALADAEPTGRESAGSSLRQRMLARISEERAAAPRPGTVADAGPIATPRRANGAWLALAASLALAAGLAATLVSTRGRLVTVETELASRGSELAQTERRLQEREATLDAILEPGVQLFQLTASGDPDPGIQLFFNRQRHRAIVHGFRLKPVPAGKAYQLWFIKDGAPVPSVTFKPEADGHARVEGIEVPSDGVVSAAAVTVEPESGSSQPTSPILLVGPLKRS